jgi:hypothetical protein
VRWGNHQIWQFFELYSFRFVVVMGKVGEKAFDGGEIYKLPFYVPFDG